MDTSGKPSISMTPTGLTFNATVNGASPPVQTVSLVNSGAGTLSGLTIGSVAYGAGATGWMQLPVLDATTANPSATLSARAIAGSLAAGTYTANIPVLSAVAQNSPQSISVTFVVSAPVVQRLTLTITGAGTVSLSPLGTGTCVNPASATCVADFAQGQAVALTAASSLGNTFSGWSGTCSGTGACNIAMDQARNVTATFTASAPTTISLSASNLTYTALTGSPNPASQSITISNSGSGSLSGLSTGTINYGAGASGWLQTPSLSATTANPSATLTVQPITAGLTAGTYSATIPVQASIASNSPQLLAVTFTVTSNSPPTLALLSSSLSFAAVSGGANPVSQGITVFNSGSGILTGLTTGTIAYGPAPTAWLQTPVLSSTTASPTATVTVQPVTFLLPAGLYTATIPIQSSSASNGSQNITATFNVSPFGLQRLTLTIAGSGSVLMSPTPGIPAGSTGYCLSPATVTCVSDWVRGTGTVLTAAAAVGFSFAGWSGTCTGVGSCNVLMDVTRDVTATFVLSSPAIALSASSVSFNANQAAADPAALTIAITNGGGGVLSGIGVGTISYGAGAAGWLQATLNTTNAPATLSIRATTGVLAQGTYTATIPVISGVASNSPRSITVTVVVASDP